MAIALTGGPDFFIVYRNATPDEILAELLKLRERVAAADKGFAWYDPRTWNSKRPCYRICWEVRKALPRTIRSLDIISAGILACGYKLRYHPLEDMHSQENTWENRWCKNSSHGLLRRELLDRLIKYFRARSGTAIL